MGKVKIIYGTIPFIVAPETRLIYGTVPFITTPIPKKQVTAVAAAVNIASVSGISYGSITSISQIAKANIASRSGVTV